MKKRFSKQALFEEWTKYRKWYDKQEKKGLALSDRSRILAKSFSEYMFYRDKISEDFTRSSDVLDEMKRLSFTSSRRQLEHLSGEIQRFLDEAAPEIRSDFLEHFAGEIPFNSNGTIDQESIVYDTIHGKISPLYIATGKHHGWYGALTDMLVYIETLGGTINWNS